MRLWILSDLHIEQCVWDLPKPRPEYDVLVAAGDIHEATEGVRWLAERADGRAVIYVPGNHEFYYTVLPEELEAARGLAAEPGVFLLADSAVTIGDVRFLGATLWTDYELQGPTAGRAMDLARTGMNDHRLIYAAPMTRFDPEDAQRLHQASRAWLEAQLADKPEGIRKTVVVTHHLPLRQSIDRKYSGDPLNPAFASHLPGVVEHAGADLWFHGTFELALPSWRLPGGGDRGVKAWKARGCRPTIDGRARIRRRAPHPRQADRPRRQAWSASRMAERS